MDLGELGRFLRRRRGLLQPEDVGLRRGPRRRTAGLRREEVAELAGLSADYLARLERGAGSQPSDQMVAALARALRLTLHERDHLLLLAGHRVPAGPGSGDHVSPGLMRILDRLTDTPGQIMGPLGETLAQNAAAVALFGPETGHTGPARSAVYRWFADPSGRSLYPAADHQHHSRVQVSQLREAGARLGSARVAALVAELSRRSPEFAHLWSEPEVGLRHSESKRFVHPEVGELELYCQAALDPDQFHTLLVFTAVPGSASADRLRLLAVVGSYDMAGHRPGGA